MVNNAGTPSGWYGPYNHYVDTATPTTPTITYNGGANTCTWKNDYDLTLSSTSLSGILRYEVDWDSDGVSNRTVSSNFIPENGFHTHTARFRAINNAGTPSAWTDNQHIHMDTAGATPVLSSAPSTANSITAVFTTPTALSGNKSITCYYGTGSNPTTAGTVSGNNCVFSSLAANTTYNFKKCITSNSGVTKCSTISSKITAGQVKDFPYRGYVEGWKVPYTGTYQLEVWGAQGGNARAGTLGGYGGYSKGYKKLSANTNLYVGVGSAGTYGTNSTGGYNGGGSSTYVTSGSGGGATHIAINNNRGILSAYNSYRGDILIVAGGGGGATTDFSGGAGGGTNGTSGTMGSCKETPGAGGTQNNGGGGSGGTGTFGTGASGYYAGGGGGYFGGGSTADIGNNSCTDSSAGGGSGYVGGVTSGSMSNGVRTGDGYARITITGID